jgi:hypothetical protein
VSFEWIGPGPDVIKDRIHELDAKTKMQIKMIFDRQAAVSTGYMKVNAPWHDNTGAARAGLHVERRGTDTSLELLFAHAVSYGIYLEVCHNARWAIILPSIRAALQELEQAIKGMWR